MLYRVETPAQLAVYEADFRIGIRSILDETGPDFGKTEADVWAELAEHLTNPDDRGLWVWLEQGVLVAWAAMKVYSDDGRLAACVTWAWASPRGRGEPSRAIMVAMEELARAAGAEGIYAQRRTRVRAFVRNVRRYGWTPQAVIVGRTFSQTAAHGREMTHRVSTPEVGHRKQADEQGQHDGARAAPGAGAPQAVGVDPGAHGARADDVATEHGDRDAASAGDLEPPKRRTRQHARRPRQPAQSGDADPGAARAARPA